MKIIRAKTMGFCAGVRRAVMTADKALEENKNGRVYTYGPLIHNPVAMKKYEERNLKTLSRDNISCLKSGDFVVIRAHGVTPEEYKSLEKTGASVIDATCPLVQVSQKKASDFASDGYAIIFTGDKNHGEVVGIEGYARMAAELSGHECFFEVVENPEEARNAAAVFQKSLKNYSGLVLMSQTTFSISMFDSIAQLLQSLIPEVNVVKSICPATHERQASLTELCDQVQGVIVIGGKNSANTNRLYNTASKLTGNAVLIEQKDEIPDSFFALNTVGLTAGASTPDEVIDQVEQELLSRALY